MPARTWIKCLAIYPTTYIRKACGVPVLDPNGNVPALLIAAPKCDINAEEAEQL